MNTERIFIHVNLMVAMLLAYFWIMLSDAATSNSVSKIAHNNTCTLSIWALSDLLGNIA